ncbi:formimidoyltransferase-cyclodeaminase-like [Tropilaelaps mercedesae]|uniref:Formimidoyltransferase-cyclodeaminase n=1 Tax=Tropilaelaps mercedesae TaxID=418985 RepID=A0A1V9Y1B7_9ACAR|nr:formimidoyltransferase-cyclodeaminase-like [Tropilaelaps mercedesae]
MASRQKIVECVPNFSEGQKPDVIEAISASIRSTQGCTLLNVDPGVSTNRTVYTFVGSPDAVIEGALAAAKAAYSLIDMSRHKGEHARLGALDVCPFVPVRGVEMEECVYCARKFGEKLAAELKVPVFLYGYAARQDYRRSVAQIRAGQYEGLAAKLERPEWRPDFGPTEFVSQWGATMAGARKFLIAYNVNLISTKEQAHKLALNIREEGRGAQQPGLFKRLQAVGWWLAERNLAQVSCNVLDNDVTALHQVFEELTRQANEMRLPVTGSEIVGLVPLKAILDAADFYIEKEKLFILEEDQKLHLVINRLGLSSISPFVPEERIVEYMLKEDTSRLLVHLPMRDFVRRVGARTVAPGGGSVAALCASTGAALAAMVGKLSFGRKAWEHLDEPMRRLIPIVHRAAEELLPLVDADTDAYMAIVVANRLGAATPEEAQVKEESVQAAVKHAIHVPLSVCRLVDRLWPTLKELASICNIASRADLQVGAKILEAATFGAYYNVMTNCEDLVDETARDKIRAEVERLRANAQAMSHTVLAALEQRATSELRQV